MDSAGPVSRRNRPAKPPLSLEIIVDAALAILDRDGLAAVSMRRVGQALDTGAASLYVYVRSRDELLAQLLERIVTEVRLPSPSDPGPWRDRLAALILDSIRVLGRHGGIATVMFANVPTGPNALLYTDAVLGLLAESGMSRQTRAWAVDLIALYITAAGTEETIHREKDPAGPRGAEPAAGFRSSFATPAAERYPNIDDLREEMLYGDGDQRARWAIDSILNGALATDPTRYPAAAVEPAEPADRV